MRTVIIGGGKGCVSLLSLASGYFLRELTLEIVAVCDINPTAPGIQLADKMRIPTFTDGMHCLECDNIELVIELTGSESALAEIQKHIKPGIRIIDHTIARIFWDLNNAYDEQNWQLKELDKLEMELEAERYFLQSIFDSNADLAVVMDMEQKIVRANKKFYEFVGKDKPQIIGFRCPDVLSASEINCESKDLDEIYYHIKETGKPHVIIRKTSIPEESHWEITRAPIYNQSGEMEFVLSTWHKITERIKLQREIESAEQKFLGFINSAKDWISIKDLEGKYIIVNPVTAKALNIPLNEFAGKTPGELLHKPLADTITRHDREVIESRSARLYDEIIPIDGQDHNFQTVRFPLTDYKGDITGVCTIARDVTRERRLQDQLVQSEKLASLGRLAAGVAHEINNPLTGILAYAEDLKEDMPAGGTHSDDISVIIRETLRCRDIVRNLLDFAKQDKPSLESIYPDTIIDQSLLLVHRLPQFKDINIEILRGKNVPMVQADIKQMIQVVLNLMINAADAMHYKGEITLSTEYDRKSSHCIISVEDNGPGIPENLIDKLFEPFFSTKGTNGLGLAVSWGIVERHRGAMEVDMADGGGAVFRILLPAFFVAG